MRLPFRKNKEYESRLQEIDEEKEISRGKEHYSESKFWEKLRSAAKKMGSKLVYYSLTLFYAMQDDAVPKKAKMTIVGALGYLILPVDVIPDFIPVIGFTDDLTIIIYALYQVISHVSDETKQRAYEKTTAWFNEEPEGLKDDFRPEGK
ncbi:YkvA family protein [Alkalicoccus urumqiensis]|uniref:DUF1232 domain-containing protein n=1 Tax=Alkalicoccus urumqiensis TaxID=1548213 RepID=A0A2P6MLX3_ALKUR|nr:YkvA family protein [Alkalicoccus urumqiensis]PRO67297.1 hypothetical protein C6I21_01700 [Alkalicoccus urumqiensis]